MKIVRILVFLIAVGAIHSRTLAAEFGTSPGVIVGTTAWDEQHVGSQGHQVARNPGEDVVHFVWTSLDHIPADTDDVDRLLYYFAYHEPCVDQFCSAYPVSFGPWSRANAPRIDVDHENKAHVVFQQYSFEGSEIPSAWHSYFPILGLELHRDAVIDWMDAPLICFWAINEEPDVAVAQSDTLQAGDGFDVIHAIILIDACASEEPDSILHLIAYTRFDTDTAANPEQRWPLPVIIDSSTTRSYVIDAADDGSGRVAVSFTNDYEPSFNGLLNIGYRESTTGGLGWYSGSELGDSHRTFITNYVNPSGPQAFGHISIAYDNGGTLHLVFDEQRHANDFNQVAIKHWSDASNTLRTITTGYYTNSGNWVNNANLAKITLGIGDGSTSCSGFGTNEDYLYVVYSKHCGESPEEQADTSIYGLCNSELYLTMSPDGGGHWTDPQDLTNTKIPDCDPTDPENPCSSEDWATIGRQVSDVDIFYILDRNPGPYYVSGWTFNEVMYLQLPGGTPDAGYLCPPACFCPCHADPEFDGMINVFDIVEAVNDAFRNDFPTADPHCPSVQTDVTCDSIVDVFDVVALVDVAFRSGDPDQFCDPCAAQ